MENASRIQLINCQIKSLEIAKAVAGAIDTIEKVAGIHSVHIEMDGTFICPDINLDELNETPMETVLAEVMKQQLAYNFEHGIQQ